jgi:hypothetical protein
MISVEEMQRFEDGFAERSRILRPVKTLARRRSVKGKIPEIEADPELESRQDLTSSSVPIRVRSWNLCFTKALMFGCEGAGGTRLRAQWGYRGGVSQTSLNRREMEGASSATARRPVSE